MTRQLFQSTRPTICVARWKMEVFAVTMAMMLAAVVGSLIATPR